MARRANLDDQVYGDEPILTKNSSDSEIIRAWGWYHYFKDENDAKGYVLTYLKTHKDQELKNLVKKISKISPIKLVNCGWNARLIMQGSELPDKIMSSFLTKLELLASEVEDEVKEKVEEPSKVVSIQERVQARTQELIGDLEEQIDIFINAGSNEKFNPTVWFRDNAIKPAIAKKISEYYNSLYAELMEALEKTDDQCIEAYSYLKRTQLKKYVEFVKSIISASETQSDAVKTSRKPRKKKEKPATTIVSKMKFKVEDPDLSVKSIKPTEILKAQQLWVFNTKYRTLSVYNAIGASGLSVKGTTITGFDEQTSLCKKLRNPRAVLKSVLENGKVPLRKLMDSVRTKESKARGRINTDTVILRAIK